MASHESIWFGFHQTLRGSHTQCIAQLCQWEAGSDSFSRLFFNHFLNFIYLFLAVLGLHCHAQGFSSCSKQGLLFVVMHRLLLAAASLVVEHSL